MLFHTLGWRARSSSQNKFVDSILVIENYKNTYYSVCLYISSHVTMQLSLWNGACVENFHTVPYIFKNAVR